jgi:hypothetical protein
MTRTVNLPEDLCATAERLYGNRFSGIEGLVVFLLNEITRQDATRLDEQEQRIIEERLKELGYI